MEPVDKLTSLFSLTGSEMPFDKIADLTPSLIWVCDDQKRFYFLNKKWQEFTGTNNQKKSAHAWLDDLHPQDFDIFRKAFDKAFEAKEIFRYNHRLRHASGGYRWVAGTASPLYNTNRDFIGYIGSGTDVHDQQKLHEQLEEEVARRTEELRRKNLELEQKNLMIEAVLDSTMSMISVVDKNFNVLSFNHTVEEYMGVKKNKVIGRNVFEVFPYLKETAYEGHVKKALNGETVHDQISESVLQKGKYLETFFIPLKSFTGEIEGVVIKVRDRTDDMILHNKLIENNNLLEDQNRELKRQSHFIQSLFDSTIDIIAVFDADFRYISMNKKGLEKYGFKKEAILGKKLTDVFPNLKGSDMCRDLERAMKGEVVHDLLYRSSILSNTNLENYYVPLFDHKNSVYAVMVIGHDITKLFETSEELRISNEVLADKNTELERSNEDLEQFAYVASHDLQEPIRKIATYSDKLLTRSKDAFSDETVMYLKRINQSTARMYELINGLLLYSRIRRHNNLFESTSLDAVLKQVLADFEVTIQQKKAVIECQRLPELEAVAVQMNQMFTNLVSNSLKFAKPDVSPVIQVAASDLTQEQKKFYKLNPKARYVNIFYLDNGIGFEQQFADKVFELFQRLHNRGTYEGSGIGLAICKKIVNNHHGMIYAFSEDGKGVTFQIILPYRQKPFA